MEIQQYQQEAKRTLHIMSDDRDRLHMVAGVISEVGEIVDIYKRHLAYGKELDKVHVLEEIGDVFWYIVNWASIKNTILENPSDPIYTIPYDLDDPYKPTSEIDVFFSFIYHLHFGEIQNMLNMWRHVCICLGFNDKDIEKSLDKNIAKLKVRYPEKFTEENALNRNVEKEREMLA